jgi:vitamin B12 transporter
MLPLLFACGFVSAQADDSPQEPLDIILVTASRTPVPMIDVGSSTTVITRDQIERQQARYVTDLLRAVPGFAVSQSGTFGSQTQVRVRGSEANHVLVLIDGVRANDPASGDEFRWEFLSTGNIERIEIIRGPQSALWGSDAIAGVVNVITRTGEDRHDVEGFAEYGSYDSLNTGLTGNTSGDNWSLSAGLEHLESDGSNVSRSGTEDDGSRMTTGTLTASLQATSELSLDIGIRTLDAWSQYDPADFLQTGLPYDADVATDTRQTYAAIGGQLTTLDGRVVHHLRMRYRDNDNESLTDGVRDSSTASDTVTWSWQSDIQIGENGLSMAFERENTDFSQTGDATFGDPNQDQRMSVNSVIADFRGKSIGSVSWLLSARYDENSDFDNALTGRLALSYAVTDTTRIRSSLGTGQKAPTFIERFGFYPGQFIGNPDLKPETSTSFDAGIDQQWFDGGLAVQLTWFHQDLNDEINGFVFDPQTFLSTAENLDGKSTRQGVEFAATWRPAENVDFAASYTYTDSAEEDAQGLEIAELRRPRHSGSLSAAYRFMENRGNVLLHADYGGEQDDIFFPPFPASSEIVTLDDYWLVGITAAYDVTPKLNLFARTTNLLDEDYEDVYGYRTPGRAAWIGMRLHFGN